MAVETLSGFVYTIVIGGSLFLFLVISFLLYHRRAADRRRREIEYREHYRYMRPDLVEDPQSASASRCVSARGSAQRMSVIANRCDLNTDFEKTMSATDAQGQCYKEPNSLRSVNSRELTSYRSVDGLGRRFKLPPLPRKQQTLCDKTLMEPKGGILYCDGCRAKLMVCSLCHKTFTDNRNKHRLTDSSELTMHETVNDAIIGNACLQTTGKRSKGKRIGLAKKLRGYKLAQVKHSDDFEAKGDINETIVDEFSNQDTTQSSPEEPLNAYYIDTGTVPPPRRMSVTTDPTVATGCSIKAKPRGWGRSKSTTSIASRDQLLENGYHENVQDAVNAPLDSVTYM